jgi:hypothetical protein
MSNENNVGTYTYTITTAPEHAQLLNYLVRTRVLPTLHTRDVQQKRLAQASTRKRRTLTPEEELERIFKFTGM